MLFIYLYVLADLQLSEFISQLSNMSLPFFSGKNSSAQTRGFPGKIERQETSQGKNMFHKSTNI